KNALRMRPDRIVVGEVRDPEAKTLFTAMNTGHDGSMGTLHANTAHDVLTRLTSPPMDVPDTMIPALDLVIMQQKHFDRSRGIIRRVSEVSELTIGESGGIQENSVFTWNPKTDKIMSTGIPSRTQFKLEGAAKNLGSDFTAELDSRREFLESLIDENVRKFDEIQSRVSEYVGGRIVR
ncbi:MAG TPA: CpaF family protein, partial [Euryarchaeota archaeon]|nr:CpaF family protein [Euryarchaeota archaeon]